MVLPMRRLILKVVQICSLLAKYQRQASSTGLPTYPLPFLLFLIGDFTLGKVKVKEEGVDHFSLFCTRSGLFLQQLMSAR